MTESRHHLRAATSLRRAAILVGRACALHHGTPEAAPPDPLADLPDHCHLDAARALGSLLDFTLGPEVAVIRLRAIDAFDPYAIAGLVAESIDWDGWMALRLGRLAGQHHRDHVDLTAMAQTPEPPPEGRVIQFKREPTDGEDNRC